MEFVLCNITITNNSIVETLFNNKILKEAAYNTKIKNKQTKQLLFSYILIPMVSEYINPELKEELDKFKMEKFINNPNITYDQLNSIKKFIYTDPDYEKKLKNFIVDVIDNISDEYLGICYSDGSVKLPQRVEGQPIIGVGIASYGMVRLLKGFDEPADDRKLCSFTKRYWTYETFADTIDPGTNNVGELSGVKNAILKADPTKILQVIISDSVYSLDSFREWIYNWRANGYVTNTSRRPIQNCELIKEIDNLLTSSKKIFLFKWTKGHDTNAFNILCDTLANNVLK